MLRCYRPRPSGAWSRSSWSQATVRPETVGFVRRRARWIRPKASPVGSPEGEPVDSPGGESGGATRKWFRGSRPKAISGCGFSNRRKRRFRSKLRLKNDALYRSRPTSRRRLTRRHPRETGDGPKTEAGESEDSSSGKPDSLSHRSGGGPKAVHQSLRDPAEAGQFSEEN